MMNGNKSFSGGDKNLNNLNLRNSQSNYMYQNNMSGGSSPCVDNPSRDSSLDGINDRSTDRILRGKKQKGKFFSGFRVSESQH